MLKWNKRHKALFVIGLMLISFLSVLNFVPHAASMPPYDQAITFPNGNSFYISYSNFSSSNQEMIENYLALYVPLTLSKWRLTWKESQTLFP